MGDAGAELRGGISVAGIDLLAYRFRHDGLSFKFFGMNAGTPSRSIFYFRIFPEYLRKTSALEHFSLYLTGQ